MGLPGGGTNFGRPLRRAIDIISRWSQENTCYVMLTDGLASYPHEELLLFDSFKKNIESEGYDFCTICYFIKATPNTEPPSAFTRMCSAFNGDFQ